MDNKLLSKLIANSNSKESSVLSESRFFDSPDFTRTPIPALNLAFSGSLSGGFAPGLTVLAGESKSFKTASALVAASAYLKKYPDAVFLYYDTEFGAPPDYIAAAGVDTSRVLHTPIADIEELKFDMISQLDAISKGDRVFILIDSIGNIASKKELDDARDEKSVADMSRAKQIKSLFRMVTPILTMKGITCFAINHTYKSQGMYPVDVVSGGTGPVYSANTVIIISKVQDKENGELNGFKFIYNVEKSRYAREKSKIPVEVSFKNGISKYSGLLDFALESGHVVKPSNGWFSRVYTDKKTGEIIKEEGKYRRANTNTVDFWKPILSDPTFNEWIESRYKVANKTLIAEDENENSEDLDLPEAD